MYVIVALNVRRLPAICLPVPSAVLWAGALLGSAALAAVPGRPATALPMDGRRLGRLAVGLARAVLCAGGYTLLDVRVSEAGLRVRVVII